MTLGCVYCGCAGILLSLASCLPARAALATATAAPPGAPPATRIAPVPPGAPEWPTWARPAAASRSDVLEEHEHVLVSDGPARAKSSSTSSPEARRFRDGLRDGPPHRHAAHDREGATMVGAAGPRPVPDAVYGSMYARPAPAEFSHREDEPPTAYMWDEDDTHAAPPSGDIVLDVALPHKEGEDHGKTARGPVVVRGPPFNSVAIGFLVYLILLTVLQTSILNVTTKQGLLGLLRPARAVAERRAADPLLDTLDPVLVAAVLDSDQLTLGGPRRGRGWNAPRRTDGAVAASNPSNLAKTFKM
ncbi:uncharacterized protein LOC113208171 [Frankliniella occidentalis]|uniref:Uncharacterized protein LOC113208171 n=1 Tax=Frankliniella occidentalis TaxID=133901 RepID=A0A6J1SQQ1_FRAOC|nr:uncharacterized protein LOC113208171 [Frankliniella occidentalis]